MKRVLVAFLTIAVLGPARTAISDDWIKQSHVWITGHLDGFDTFGREQGRLPSNVGDIFLGYLRKNGGELGIGYSCPRRFEIQAFYAQTPVNLGGDSLSGPGDVHLADATAHVICIGGSRSARIHLQKWGPLGDGLASAGVLLGLVWIAEVRPTATASTIGIRGIEGRTSFTWGFDARLDQRIYRGVVGSLGLRRLFARRAISVETESGSRYGSAHVNYSPYVYKIGLGYWF